MGKEVEEVKRSGEEGVRSWGGGRGSEEEWGRRE